MNELRIHWKIVIWLCGIFLSIGAIAAYFIPKWDSQPQKQVDLRTVKPVKSQRELLLEKYKFCGGVGDISQIPNAELKTAIDKICLANS